MLIAYQVATQLIHAMAEIVPRVARHDAALASQLRRATSSVLLNIAEGDRRVGKDQAHLFRIAAGSCAEVRAALEVASAWGYVTNGSLAEVRAIIDRELGLLFGLTRTRNNAS